MPSMFGSKHWIAIQAFGNGSGKGGSSAVAGGGLPDKGSYVIAAARLQVLTMQPNSEP